MSDFLFAVNSVSPIIAMVLVGYIAKRIGLVTREIAKGLNKMVFRLFLPIMLFLNVYKIQNFADIGFGFVIFVLIASITFFGIGVASSMIFTKEPNRRGVITQAAFRSNYAYIGIPLATSLFGEEGSIVSTVLSVALIPLMNVLAVISLTAFGDSEDSKFNIKRVLVGIVKNPLIQAIALGGAALVVRAVFVKCGVAFRLSDIDWLYSGVMSKLGAVATPLALISLGADFEFSKIGSMKKEIICGVVLRCISAPLLGIGTALIINRFGGAHFAAFVAAFASPLAISTVPMSESMGADHNLAGQIVVWSTITSAVSLFLIAYVLRLIGIF